MQNLVGIVSDGAIWIRNMQSLSDKPESDPSRPTLRPILALARESRADAHGSKMVSVDVVYCY